MKKLFLLIALLASVAFVNAQDFDMVDYYRYTGSSTLDTIATQYGTDFVAWQVKRNDLYLYRVSATLDEVSGSATTYAILQGSNDYVNWYEVDTLASTAGTEAVTVDGTVFLTDLSTGIAYRFLRVWLCSTASGATAASIWHFDYVGCRLVRKP